MKCKNYYSIHRNKKPKITTKHKESTIEAILKLSKALNNFANAIRNRQPIPEYKKGGILNKEYAIVSDKSRPELILK